MQLSKHKTFASLMRVLQRKKSKQREGLYILEGGKAFLVAVCPGELVLANIEVSMLIARTWKAQLHNVRMIRVAISTDLSVNLNRFYWFVWKKN